MPRNKLMDLNDILFEQLENLVTAEDENEIKMEINRAKAVSGIATNIIETANLSLQAKKIQLEYALEDNSLIPQLGNENG